MEGHSAVGKRVSKSFRRAAEIVDETTESGDFAKQDFAIAAFGVGIVLMVLLLV